MHVMQEQTATQSGFARQPAAQHQTPGAVLNDADLATFDKRAILSSWASDRYAVESAPWLRQVPGVHKRLALAEILAALRALDDDEPPPKGGAAMRIVRLARTECDRANVCHARPSFNRAAAAARLAAHRSNLKRYRMILTTPLTDLERGFVNRRIAEERVQIERLEEDMREEPPAAMSA